MKSKLLSSASLLVGLCLMLGSCLDTNDTTPYQRFQEEIAKIDTYLALNPPGFGDFIVKDAASGIRMVVTERPTLNIDGTEPIPLPPTAENRISVSYVGRLFSTGEQFDANTSYTFTITDQDANGEDVINGWKTALGMMYQGMKATVYIPSVYAYGTSGNNQGQVAIPANAILVFDLDLKSVETEDQEPRLTNDKLAIANKLGSAPDVEIHPNGLSYIPTKIGTGVRPDLYDQVEIKYTGKLLDGTVFAEGFQQGPNIVFSSRPVNYIHGFGLGLQLMREGGKATFYIPSALGYGIHSSSTIPANTNLIFEVELLKVIPIEE